jgi:hypothetical protein
MEALTTKINEYLPVPENSVARSGRRELLTAHREQLREWADNYPPSRVWGFRATPSRSMPGESAAEATTVRGKVEVALRLFLHFPRALPVWRETAGGICATNRLTSSTMDSKSSLDSLFDADLVAGEFFGRILQTSGEGGAGDKGI